MPSCDGEAHTHLSSQDILHSPSVSNPLHSEVEARREPCSLFHLISKVFYIQMGLQKDSKSNLKKQSIVHWHKKYHEKDLPKKSN